MIGSNISHTDSKDVSHRHSWNDQEHAFGYQLDQWGVKKFFHNSDEVIIRELKFYIEDWENFNIKNKRQLSCTMFDAKYGSMDLYNEYLDKRFIIDQEQLQFDNMQDGL